MTWLKLDDNFPEHPKIAGLPDSVKWFHVRAMCYCAKYQTRGEITPSMLKALYGKPAWVAALVEACLWDTTSRGGWAIHDFEVYNPPKDPELNSQLSRIRAEAGRMGGLASGEARRSKPEANGKANLLQANEPPSRPVPVPRETTNPTDSSSLSTSAEREVFEAAISKLPQKYQRDDLTIDEMEAFARDFAGKHLELATAITECRRNGELCFAGNLRKYMPGGKPNGRNNHNSPNKAAEVAGLAAFE